MIEQGPFLENLTKRYRTENIVALLPEDFCYWLTGKLQPKKIAFSKDADSVALQLKLSIATSHAHWALYLRCSIRALPCFGRAASGEPCGCARGSPSWICTRLASDLMSGCGGPKDLWKPTGARGATLCA